jgi:hypothetical protein
VRIVLVLAFALPLTATGGRAIARVVDDLSDDVAFVRRVLARELDTINEYEALAKRAQDPRVRAFLSHLANEEKEHVAEAMALIRSYDVEQEAKSAAVDVGAEHFSGAATQVVRAGFTVGSLKGTR